jgi:hypothetical protein
VALTDNPMPGELKNKWLENFEVEVTISYEIPLEK